MIEEITNNKILLEDLEYISNSNIEFDKMKNSTVLVTGGTGLIGVSLIRALLYINEKHNTHIKIISLVRNENKAKNIYGKILDRNDFELLLNDINNKVNTNEKIDYIFHCASITTSKTMIEKPVETLMTSVNGTKNILDLASSKNVKSVVYVSSMEMYGTFDNSYSEIDEEKLGFIDPLKVRSNYPESKRLCENMCIAYLSEYNVHVKIARLAQTFGAGILQSENRVFAQFARSVIEHKDIVLHTLGKSEGNYCYTSDTVTGLFSILLNGNDGEAYNVSNPETHTTISEMAKMVCEEIADNKIKVIYDIPKDNKFGYAADTKMKLNSDKLRSLGWKPEINLKNAYLRLIDSLNIDSKM